MRLPDPIANTTTEAYLAYKAGVLNVGDLKPSLYDPYLHYDAWLAYWAGLTQNYPVKNVGKNLLTLGNSVDDYFTTDRDGSRLDYKDPNDYVTATFTRDSMQIDSYINTGYRWLSKWLALKKNTNYNLYMEQTGLIKIVGFNDKSARTSGTYIAQIGAGSSQSYQFNSGDYEYVAISFYPGGNALFQNIMLTEGTGSIPYEPYTGEPEILTDEEALVAYLSGVTNTYPEEYSDPIDARITGYLRYLVSARFGRPDYPMNNIEFYLSLMKPPIVTNDTPSSNIELDNTAWAELIDVKMYGDTFQQTYTGKNLLKLTPQASTSNGITATLTDGIIQYSGTASTNWAIIAARTANPIPAGDYMLSMQETFTTNYAYAISVTYTDNTTATFECWQTVDNKRTVTFAKDVASYYVYLTGLVTNTSYSGTISLMLESGSTATSWEPYVGGVPAPNPDYPQTVQTVAGEQEIKISGKNLFNVKYKKDQWNGASVETEGSTVIFSPNSSGNMGINYSSNLETVKLSAGATISWSTTFIEGEEWTSGAFVTRLELNYVDGTNENLYSGDILHNNYTTVHKISKTLEKDVATVRVYGVGYQIVGLTKPIKFGLQLEINSTATAYEPYAEQEYQVKLNSGINYWQNFQDGFLPLSGSYPVANPTYPNACYVLIPLKAGQTLETTITDDRKLLPNGRIRYIDKTTNQVVGSITATTNEYFSSTVSFSDGFRSGEITAIKDFTVGVMTLNSLDYTHGEFEVKPVNFDGIELCKIGDYQDRIYCNEGTWYLEKNTNKIVVDGEFGGYNTSNNWYYRSLTALPTPVNKGDLYSNYFRGSTRTYMEGHKQEDGLCGISTYTDVIFRNTAFSDATSYKTWLGTAKPEFYYQLAEPSITPITNAALVAQLDALAAAKSYNEKTYITVEATDPNLPALLKVEAVEYR